MRSKKIILFLTVLLVLVFAYAFKNNINAESLQTSDAFYVNGAQVRTSGNAGIRFVGYIGNYNDTNVTKYGILMAFGETEASNNFYKGATINGKEVAHAECESVNENGYFYITLYDIPEVYYNQKVSARAYVIEGDNIVYSSNVTTRSLGDVVKSAYNSGDTSEFVLNVYEALQNSFYEINYELNGGTLTNKPDYIHSSSSLKLPIPTKDGYTFLGWKLYSSSQELVWEISKPSDNITLYAVWGNEGIYVGENLSYTTLKSAISAASSNSTIIVMPGTYEGATINKTLTIKAYNALTNLDLTDETLQSVFTSDLIIAANNVTISGVVITGTAKFMNKTGMNISNPTIKYSIVRNSTVNPTSSDSNVAPFNFTNTSAYSINNLTITDCKIEQIATGRPMIAYLSQVNGLTIKNSEFYGRKTLANYNDGIKTNNETTYGVKGNVTITGNYFENYQQYLIWLRSYGAGTYTIENNQFVNCGFDAAKNAISTFVTYSGTSNETVKISQKYNTATNSYIFFRIDSANALTNTNTTIDINYNKINNCKGNYYIKNSTGVTPNIENNYWGTTTLDSSKFTGANVPSAYYSSASAVPTKGTVEDLSYNITYNLNGGKWLSDEYTYDECVNDLVADLSAYYGKEITSTNVADTTYGASVTMTDFFFTHETYSTKWTWLAEFMMTTRQNDANQSSGYSNLVNKDDRTWRFEVQAFTSKTVPSWPYGSDYSIESVQNNYKEAADFKAVHYSGPTSYVDGKGVTLVEPIYNTCIFLYWVDQNDKIYYDNIPTNVSGDLTLTAVYDNIVNVSSVVFENLVDTIEIIDTYQLNWEIKPLDATNKTLTFSSSNNSIFTVDANGLITPIALGTATLSVVVEGNKELNFTQEITIIPIAQFVFSYETTSYTTVGDTIKINNYYLQDNTQITDLNWESKNPNIATVENGVVTGVSTGTATIRSSLKNNPNTYVDFTITVLPDSLSEIAKIIIDAHNSNIFTRYDLLVGTKNEGDYGYLKDMIGSVSDLLYNNPLEIDTKYLATGNANTGAHNTNELATNGIEFVTVHYTGNFVSTADSDNNASYFANASNVSIHYVTGNHGKYSNGTISSQVYQVLDHAHGAWHAGDSSARDYVGEFKWQATGVQYDGCNLLDVEFTASNDFYFEINGKKTNIPLPGTYDYSSRNTDHIYNSNGTISSQSDYSSPFTNRSPESFFNDQGFPIKVVDGEYYMGTTWWSYRQVREGRICGSGGNRNSIGIEACVNKGSDVWQTYQKTAQLVAKLLYDNNLDVSRVKGHHFFDGKNCPQPLLENNLEIWNEFIDQVIYEYQLLTLNINSRYTISMEAISNSNYINSYGRLSNQPLKSSVITYKVIITDTVNNTTEEIILSSIIEGTNLNK